MPLLSITSSHLSDRLNPTSVKVLRFEVKMSWMAGFMSFKNSSAVEL